MIFPWTVEGYFRTIRLAMETGLTYSEANEMSPLHLAVMIGLEMKARKEAQEKAPRA